MIKSIMKRLKAQGAPMKTRIKKLAELWVCLNCYQGRKYKGTTCFVCESKKKVLMKEVKKRVLRKAQ